LFVFGLMLVFGGCAKKEDPAPSVNAGGPAAMMPGFPGPGGISRRETGKIMARLDKGPEAPRRVINEALKADSPSWDKILPKTKEYAELAAELGKHDPPAGEKEAWNKHTAAFAEDAGALDKAAQAKDLEATKAANTKLNGSCMGCHNEHRMQGGPRGPRGPGGKRKGGGKGPPQA
jgi:hypothetical protein